MSTPFSESMNTRKNQSCPSFTYSTSTSSRFNSSTHRSRKCFYNFCDFLIHKQPPSCRHVPFKKKTRHFKNGLSYSFSLVNKAPAVQQGLSVLVLPNLRSKTCNKICIYDRNLLPIYVEKT